MELVPTQKEIYKPTFDETLDVFIDLCPFKPRQRNIINYECRCKYGSGFRTYSEFKKHIETKSHKNFLINYSRYDGELDKLKQEYKKMTIENEFLKRKNKRLSRENELLNEKLDEYENVEYHDCQSHEDKLDKK
tara:strand:- start:26 stop:427 length:402 start_codon:yes stop_codon:yes gene_type:complete